MPVFNQNRSRVVQTIFVVVFVVIALQLINLQIISSKYRRAADDNANLRKVIYANRGIIFDKNKKSLLENVIMYDLIITPSETKGMDTLAFCELMGMSMEDYKKRIVKVLNKTGSRVKPGVFEALLTPEKYGKLSENIYKFSGFSLSERSVRSYPYRAAGNILGYIAEVDTGFLRRHSDEGYEMGDYAGMTGLERTYEKILMGQRGVKRLIKDKLSRNMGSYENGAFDTTAIAGKNLFSTIDIELQKLGEKLMSDKVGGIIAIDPQTGGILCMVSAPTYDPNFLTGPDRRKHFSRLFVDPKKPLMNRPIFNRYSPGSTFKTVVGVIGLSEGVIDEHYSLHCTGAFYGCGTGRPKCLDVGTYNIRTAIAHSDNSFFATVYKRLLDQNRFSNTDSALENFNRHAYSFGLGHRLGVDLPSENSGNIPTSKYYRKMHGNRWNSCNIISNAIGQGEVGTTLMQLSNVMAIIANKGWYYTPHLIDSIEGGDKDHVLDPYKIKNYTLDIPDTVFNIVHDGMQGVMEYGTGAAVKVPGITICGKTGTVENYYRGEKQKDHAFFGAFAPRENPRIAIAVMCENAGFGSQSAAPIASLMIEKYLRDSIAGKPRKDLEERITKTKLIPKLMQIEIDKKLAEKNKRDSIQALLEMDREEKENSEAEAEHKKNEQKNPKPPTKKTPVKNINNVAVLTDEKKNKPQFEKA
ncbi:MAG: penicillin-binding protein 2 [Chitinophagaceae bacterium]|nr:penicillin-binding protein 2 [Chitinophagaceae bacterium]